ncbi:MAG: hypothetical protein KIT39_15220 [Nitrospirales bacterium]|nr:hypothetical protein [Nitrospirales bacterium]
MPILFKRSSTNVKGSLLVDSTWIYCDTYRQLAPPTFKEDDDYSTVSRLPETTQKSFLPTK